jgi:hypothetical protein
MQARRVLDGVLVDRIRFDPDADHRRYQLTLPVAFDRLIVAAMPALRRLQEMMASPMGFETGGNPFIREF